MKSLVLTLLALTAGTASAETIGIKSELTRDGELVSSTYGRTEAGKEWSYHDFTIVEYTDSASEIGGVVELHKAKLGIGLQISLVPVISSTGEIICVLKASNSKLLSMEKFKVGKTEIEAPQVREHSIQQSRLIKSGVAVQYPLMSSDEKHAYVLTLTTTRIDQASANQ